jgi:hypothetical protein
VEWQVDVIDGKYVKKPGLREDNWVWTPQWVIDMHQPQMWGYVQFSGNGKIEDPTHRARMSLQHIYYRQKDYREKHGNYISSLQKLGCESLQGFLRPPRIYITQDGWKAEGVVQTSTGPKSLSIRQDSLLRIND